MNNNNNSLGRNKLPWSQDVWNRIDQAVHDEVQRIRIAAKVIPVRPYPNALSIPADTINGLPAPIPRGGAAAAAPAAPVPVAPLTVNEGDEPPFIEISRSFALTENQCESEEKLGNAAMLARFAATAVAMAEDILIFQGGAAPLPPGVTALRAPSAGNGLLGLAANNLRVAPPAGAAAPVYGEETFIAVTKGIAELQADGQPGPYALMLGYPVYADTYRPIAPGPGIGALITVADRIKPLVTGGFYGTSTLPEDRGLLVSLGGEPTTIAVSLDATTSFTQQDIARLYQFTVVERVQYRARDPRAICSFTFA